MRTILGILLLLIGFGLVACRIEGQTSSPPLTLTEVDWVRTVDGWERPQQWTPSLAGPPAIHPMLLAAAQVLVSVFALVAATGPASPLREIRLAIRQAA